MIWLLKFALFVVLATLTLIFGAFAVFGYALYRLYRWKNTVPPVHQAPDVRYIVLVDGRPNDLTR